MNFLKPVVAGMLAVALTALVVMAEPAVETDAALGERLVRQLWVYMATPDMDSMAKFISPGFQAVHQNGSNNRDQEIELVRNLKLGTYTLTDIKITRSGSVIVASYFVSVEETIGGKRLSKKPAARLSVFLETGDGWHWVAHANLHPLQ